MSEAGLTLGRQGNLFEKRNLEVLRKATDDANAAAAAADAAAVAAAAIASSIVLPSKATGAEIDAGSDDAKFATSKAIADSNVAFIADIPLKASASDLDTGTNDTKWATAKALKNSLYADEAYATAAARAMWPIGAVFISVVSTDPSTLLGFGTWAAIGAGRVLVGLDSGNTAFDTVEETGGALTVDLSHVHAVDPPSTTTSDPSVAGDAHLTDGTQRHTRHPHTHTVDIASFNSGSAGSAVQSIVQPYLVVYMWKRTA